MFNRDGIFGKKDEPPRNEPRSSVNVTPGLGGSNPPLRQPTPEPTRPDLRFAEVPKPQAPQPRVEEPTTGSRLTVGPDIKLRGAEITDCDTLVVEGRVEAAMDSRVIHIAESGVFSGTVSIDIAEIHGRFEGQLTARKQLVIYSTGRVSGDIRYGKIRMEEGAELSGDISTLAQAPAAVIAAAPAAVASPPPAAAPAPAASAPAATSSPALASAVSSTLHVQRPGQPAAPIGEPQPAAASAAASREPAPSRPPKGAGKSGAAGINSV